MLALAVAALGWLCACQDRRRRVLRALGVGICLFLAGGLARTRESRLLEAPLTSLPAVLSLAPGEGRIVKLTGIFEEDPEAGDRVLRASVRGERVEDGRHEASFTGRVLLTWPPGPREHGPPPPYEGRRLTASVRLRVPRNFGNPGAFDYVGYLERRGIEALGAVKSTRLMTVEPGPARFSLATALRRRFDRILFRLFEGPGGGLSLEGTVLRASLLGGRSGLPAESERALVASGVYHILAISGLQVAVFGGSLLVILRRLAVPERGALLLAVAATLLYGSVAAPSPSVRRAVLTGALAGAARFSHRRTPGLSLLAAVTFLSLALHPLDLSDPGFHLTFSATAGILLFAPRLAKRLRARWGLSGLVSASLSAQATTFPIVASWFHRVVPYGIASNLLAVPLGSAAVILGIALLPADAISQALSSRIASLAALAVRCLLAIASVPVEGTALSLRVAPPSLLALTLAGAGVLLLAVRRTRPIVAGSALLALALGLILLGPHVSGRVPCEGRVPSEDRVPCQDRVGATIEQPTGRSAPGQGRVGAPGGTLTLDALDVGQGDALLVGFPNGETMLVDGGGFPGSTFDVGSRVLAPELERRGLHRLGRILLTHAHEDHGGGLREILRSFRVGEMLSPDAAEGPLREELETMARGRGARVLRIRRGYTIREGATEIECLAPFPGAMDGPNSDSVVLRITHGERSILLTGDIGHATESRLVASGLRHADVLKVAHHGSAHSTSDLFLSALSPRIALMSVGEANRFAHPSEHVLRRLAARRTSVLRTDRDGCVRVAICGNRLYAGSMLPGHPLAYPGPPVERTRASSLGPSSRAWSRSARSSKAG